MKVLVISDIHGRKFWRNAISDNIEKVDKVVFLGDYIDPYPEEIKENPDLMECNDFYDAKNLLNMLNDIVGLKKNEPDRFVLLTGNHTDSYIWSKFHAASRTDYRHWEKYHKFFSQNLKYFNLVWTENNTIFSHAGISEGWANRMWESLGFPENELSSVKEIAEVLRDTPLADFNDYYIKPLGDISHYRWGEAQFGSCEWADIREHLNMQETLKQKDFIPVGEDGIYQVFGHSQLQKPIITDKWAGLDCRKAFIVNTKTHDIEDASNSSLC